MFYVNDNKRGMGWGWDGMSIEFDDIPPYYLLYSTTQYLLVLVQDIQYNTKFPSDQLYT